MKSTYLRKLFKTYMAENLPNFAIKGHLIYHTEIDLILRGFSFEDSAFDANTFNIYVFVQPLFLPTQYLWFNFGERLHQLTKKGTDKWWTISSQNEPQIMREITTLVHGVGMDFLNRVKNPKDLSVEFVNKFIETPNDFNLLEAISYSKIFCGEYHNAYESLKRLNQNLEKAIKQYPYAIGLKDNHERVSLIKEYLQNNENDLAENQLRLWAKLTKDALKL